MEPLGDIVVRALTARSRGERIEAYGRLVERFRDMACGYAYSILGDFHQAEDAAQDAFVTAFEKLDRLDKPEAFPGWFRRIVWSTCGRMTRRKKLPTAALDAAGRVEADAADPHELLEKKEMRDEVLKAIRRLPARQREVTALFYINGYSQNDFADFLEVPVGTVKNRLNASRSRLKERMLHMVEETLHKNAPDERLDKKVIDRLLARPDLLNIEGHPVQQVWEAIRRALVGYEVVTGSEVEDRETFNAVEDHAWDLAYHPSDAEALRYQTTTVTMAAIRGRSAPVRLLTAGRVFRPCGEDQTHSKVFHQVDGVCIEAIASVQSFKATCERVLKAAVPGAPVGWQDHDYGFVVPGFMATVAKGEQRLEALGGGILRPEALAKAGYAPEGVAGFAWGLSLDRLAMMRIGLKDIRQLWRPPYIQE